MTDFDNQDDLTPGDLRRQLEDEKARIKELTEERDKAVEEAGKAAREAAFTAADIPADAEFFRKHYDGPADAEAIKAEAIKAKVLEPPPPDTPQAELDAHAAIENAAAGSNAAPGPVDPNVALLEEMERIAKENPAFASQRIAEFLQARGQPVDRGGVVQAPGGAVGGVETV